MTVPWNCFFGCLVASFLLPVGLAGRGSERHTYSEESRRREADRVTALPGQPSVKFQHYAGYVTLQPQKHKALFYWFFEAQDGVPDKPLVLWLNGGPGCSSVAYGAAQELGPFLVRSNGTELTLNKFSWNKVANMLFLEAPVGVGFSYTNSSNDLTTLGDRITAHDSYTFLIEWFKRFPDFKSHDFYITGESYAGHYVPQLAELIYERNKGASKGSYINFKGFLIGNAAINDRTDYQGFIEYAWSHAIISDQLYEDILKDCKSNATRKCATHMTEFLRAYSDINIYSIYSPICLASATYSSTKLVPVPRFLANHELWHELPLGYDPCTEDYVEKYFNRDDVQKALHANVTRLSYPYTSCSDVIKTWNDSPDTVLPIFRKLLSDGFRVWVYSGDTDGRVPVTSTRYSINELGLRVKEGWRSWFDRKGQVAGWVVTYQGGLTMATVRGAGHQVPVFAPHQSLSLFSHFLSATPLPSSRS